MLHMIKSPPSTLWQVRTLLPVCGSCIEQEEENKTVKIEDISLA